MVELIIEWIVRKIIKGLLVLFLGLNFIPQFAFAQTMDEALAELEKNDPGFVYNPDEWELNEPVIAETAQTPAAEKEKSDESGQ